MGDANHTVSKVGQALIEHVMTEVVRTFDRSGHSESALVEQVLDLSYASIALALGWMEVALLVENHPERNTADLFERSSRLGKALALERFQVLDRPDLQKLVESLKLELEALATARAAIEEETKGPPN
jgi:hypothetical protein